MPRLEFDLIREIVSHASRTDVGSTTDPSTNPILANAGVGMVTSYIEQLSLLGIVCNPTPIFGTAGGMWIGYSLTDRALALAQSEQELRRAVADLTGDAKSE